jgi:hypothetical protein
MNFSDYLLGRLAWISPEKGMSRDEAEFFSKAASLFVFETLGGRVVPPGLSQKIAGLCPDRETELRLIGASGCFYKALLGLSCSLWRFRIEFLGHSLDYAHLMETDKNLIEMTAYEENESPIYAVASVLCEPKAFGPNGELVPGLFVFVPGFSD